VENPTSTWAKKSTFMVANGVLCYHQMENISSLHPHYRKDQPHEKLTYERIKEVYHESFTSPQMGKSDVYWIDAKIIEEFRMSVGKK
jgi:hypothetical protein